MIMKIDEAVRRAQDSGFDKQKFVLKCGTKEMNCKFLDAYFGFFEVEGENGFITADSIRDIPHEIRFVD